MSFELRLPIPTSPIIQRRTSGVDLDCLWEASLSQHRDPVLPFLWLPVMNEEGLIQSSHTMFSHSRAVSMTVDANHCQRWSGKSLTRCSFMAESRSSRVQQTIQLDLDLPASPSLRNVLLEVCLIAVVYYHSRSEVCLASDGVE